MFSSITSYFFGSNTPATTTNSETNHNPTDLSQQEDVDSNNLRIDAENTISVSSLTPSVTGSNRNNNIVQHLQQQNQQQGKRGKNKRNRNNKKQAQQQQQPKQQKLPQPTLTKLLTPNEFFDDDLDENEWFIVEKEDEEVSLPQTDSEEELSIVEAKSKSASAASSPVHAVAAAAAAAERRQQHRQYQHQNISSHSLYSGPRPQQQRNLRSRNSGARHNNNGGSSNNQHPTFNPSSLSPPRSISVGVGNVDAVGLADGDMTRSLYVVAASNDYEGSGGHNGSEYGYGANISMEESWFVTPPPCFTSIGPINMETSPFENLLIEHPSMSVYRSIRSAQEATESFVNLDLGVEESHERRQEVVASAPAAAAENRRNNARSPRAHIDGLTATQLKQELLARSNQKIYDKKQRETWCRGAMKRANMVRDYQSKGSRQRRADMQHCKVVSGANNNRKSFF